MTDRDPVPELIRDLCSFESGVVADDNEALFERIGTEVDLEILRFPSGETTNGWQVPQNWRVERATLSRDGEVVFDGRSSALGVGRYSRSFHGELDWQELRPHLVTNPELPEAYVFHCMWQYRPWDADWALSVPHRTYHELGPARYLVDLETRYEPGEMLVAHHHKQGRSDRTIVFQAHTCHPHMANDGFAGVALLVRLFQWLAERDTHYSYRLVLGPEHLGTVFYLRALPAEEIDRMIGGAFCEMPGTGGAIKIASSFLGDQGVDQVFAHAARHHSRAHQLVPWRRGAGNDETVWEAPGYEVPFVEMTRSEDLYEPFREYHTSLDTPELMAAGQLSEFYEVLLRVVETFESNATIHRQFDGLVCLSNPAYDLYMERPDPAVAKDLPDDADQWGYLLDCLLRYFDGSMTVLDIARKHDLPFDRLLAYIRRFEEKGLVRLELAPIERPPAARAGASDV